MQEQEGNKKNIERNKKPMKNKEHEAIIVKENSITLAKGAITMATNEKVKILSKKWGKPKKEVYEGSPLYDGLDGYTTYIWKKDKTTIKYIIPVDKTFCDFRKHIEIYSSDKNIKIFGIKVGMERKKAEKIEKKLGDYAPYYECKNGKVNYIYSGLNRE